MPHRIRASLRRGGLPDAGIRPDLLVGNFEPNTALLLDAETLDTVKLFEATGSPCYCRFFHFEGTNNEWLARCAHESTT